MPRIRACHVQVLPLLTGAQRAMIEIFRHVDRSRYDLHVACQQPGPMTEELERLGVRCHSIASLERPIAPLRDLRAMFALERLFRRERFDLVHTHTSKPGILGRWAARRARVPWVIHHVHGFAFHPYQSPHAAGVYRRLERWAAQLSDLVIFTNHEEREMAVRQQIVPADKCLTIHNGIDLAPYSETQRERCRGAFRAAHNIAADELLILFIGRFYQQKQPLILPAIAEALQNKLPSARWRIVIAGSGPLEAALESAVARSPAAERIIFAGWQEQPHQAYHGADLLIQPSLWEGLPLTLVEAQAAGLPVVVSNIMGNREAVSSQTGILCSPQDAAAYADALARLIANPLERARMGQAAKVRAQSDFNGYENLGQIARLYDQRFFGVEAAPARRLAA